MQFAHLHVHNEYSILDGIGTAKSLLKEAKKKNITSMALTNHGNIDGVLEFQKVAKEYEIKPIIGCELYCVPDNKIKQKGEKRYHAVVLVENDEGWSNLCKMLTDAGTNGFYYRPRVSFDSLINHCEGLTVTTACYASFLKHESGQDVAQSILKKTRLCCEVMPLDMEGQAKHNRMVMDFANENGLPIIATNDVHYPTPDGFTMQDYVLAIQQRKQIDDKKRFRFSVDSLYVKSAQEIFNDLQRAGLNAKEAKKAIVETVKIAKSINYTIDSYDVWLPVPEQFKAKKEETILLRLARQGLKKKGLYNVVYLERLKYEIEQITRKNFVRYFLIVYDFIQWAKRQGIVIGPGRGSVGGSLIAYAIGITSVDPIKFDLLFSRFISEARIDLPDIDIDIEDTKREEIKNYLRANYGKENVAGVSTFMKMKGRTVIRDLCRVSGIAIQEADRVAKAVEEDLHTCFKETPEGRIFKRKHKKLAMIAEELEGQIRAVGQHAAGVVILPPGDISRGNLCLRNKIKVINWDKRNLEYMGLVKFDLLGLSTLSILAEAKRLIKENHNIDINFEEIPLDDVETIKMINAGDCVGVFQLGSAGLRKFCAEIGITDIEDIISATALWRPGPLRSGMTQHYVDRKHGKEKINWICDEYKRITKSTYGVMVYQEQVMQVINEIAGIDLTTCDKIRKVVAKSKQDEIKKYRTQFLKGCENLGKISKQTATNLWKNIETFGSYGFNRSHSVEYSFISFWTAYLKCHYFKEYMAAVLSYAGETHKEEHIRECAEKGLILELPKAEFSDIKRWVPSKDKDIIYMPLIALKFIAEKTAKQIQDYARKRELVFSKTKKPNKRVMQIMNDVYGFDNEKGIKDVNLDEIKDKFDFDITTLVKIRKICEERFGIKRVCESDLKKCQIPSRIKFIKAAPTVTVEGLETCQKCELRKECDEPVPPSNGLYRVAIVGEAPGKDENEQQQGFVGRAGAQLWKSLALYGLKREQFYITNVVKCFPSQTRTPTVEQIKICSEFLKQELEQLQPALILSFGNTGLQFFAGKKSGIMGLSGSCEWHQGFQAWVFYCLHPASILHNPDNRDKFNESIKIFADTVKNHFCVLQ